MKRPSFSECATRWPIACLALGLALVSAGVRAQGRAIQSPVGAGLALVEDAEGGYGVVHPGRVSEEIATPPGAMLTAFHELGDGWFAGGFRWTERGRELVLLSRAGAAVESILPPGNVFGLRFAPLPLVAEGKLVGLAWLEGDGGERNAVMTARRIDGGWGPVETVSPVNEEGQLALTGAVLEDGSLLLVWAAVEGGDEEILWSLSRGDGWIPPLRLHPDNVVPDVMPAAAATGSGAVVAWSQFDGRDYRLRIWRFDGASWSDTGFVGEEGSFRASLFPVSSGVGMLYEVTTPRSWSLIEVEDGRLARRASVSREGWEQRPLVVSESPAQVRLGRAADSASFLEVETQDLVWIEEP